MQKTIRKSTWILMAALVLLLAACAPGAAPDAATSEDPGAVIPETGATQSGATVEFDEQFINMMVPHHEGAVEMALIAQERAEHPEIRQMAEAIVAGQAGEIEMMKVWKQAWYGSSDTPSMREMPMLHGMPGMSEGAHSMDMQAEVDLLREADEPFDLAFIDAMIPHHQSAIDTARLAQQQATRPEIKEMAEAIIDAQQQEIDQMLAWREAWYGDAPSNPSMSH